ncbi:MAG: RnfH family protein [Betaproteobacteria bacterium]|nr:RnfH family protein [Betaproteobacteria bacterium]
MRVEVVHAERHRQVVRPLTLGAGATVADALAASGLGGAVVGLDGGPPETGVWGRRVPPDHPLEDGDRIELLRPLLVDPKDARRRRAARGA